MLGDDHEFLRMPANAIADGCGCLSIILNALDFWTGKHPCFVMQFLNSIVASLRLKNEIGERQDSLRRLC